MSNFWQQLPQPIIALAPMAGVTDSPFRQMCCDFGADVVYSEMASTAALVHKPVKTLSLLWSEKKEQPYVIQLFGSQPEYFAQAVRLLTDSQRLKDLGFKGFGQPAGFDINLGCPVPKVLKQTAGCELFKNLDLAYQVIESTIKHTALPVSIKIRTEVGPVTCGQFLQHVSDLDIKAVMIHGRSYRQGFSGPINTEAIKEARQYFSGIILANGGITNAAVAQEILAATQANGLGLARGACGRPWLFQEIKQQKTIDLAPDRVFKLMWQQAKLAQKYSQRTNLPFIEIRKHLAWYVVGLPQAKQWRQQLVQVSSLAEMKKILRQLKA